MYGPSELTGINLFFVFNSFSVFCCIIFANRIENKKISENVFTATEVRFLSNAPTQNRPPVTPDFRQTQTPPDLIIGATIASFVFSSQSLYRQNLITICFRIARTAHSSVTDIG
jgi:hypothetical protein